MSYEIIAYDLEMYLLKETFETVTTFSHFLKFINKNTQLYYTIGPLLKI